MMVFGESQDDVEATAGLKRELPSSKAAVHLVSQIMAMAVSVWSELVGKKRRVCVSTRCLLTGELNVVAAVGEQNEWLQPCEQPDTRRNLYSLPTTTTGVRLAPSSIALAH